MASFMHGSGETEVSAHPAMLYGNLTLMNGAPRPENPTKSRLRPDFQLKESLQHMSGI